MANLFGRFLGREGIWLGYCFCQRGCDQRTDTLSEQIFSEYWCADRLTGWLTGWLTGSVVYDCSERAFYWFLVIGHGE